MPSLAFLALLWLQLDEECRRRERRGLGSSRELSGGFTLFLGAAVQQG